MGLDRQVPRWSDLKPYLQVDSPRLDRAQARLDRAHTIGDLRAIAKRRVPKMVFDYTDGAAETEASLQRARGAFDAVEFAPNVLRDVAAPDTSTTVGGRRSALPFGIAPTGFTRLMHADGEYAGVAAAVSADIPFALSTMGTVALDRVAAAGPGADLWFQLYVWRDRAKSSALLDRVADAGFGTLILTVDTPVGGARLRDARNGMTVPPRLRTRTIGDIATHPRWWIDKLTTEPLAFASLDSYPGSVEQLINEMFDPSVTFDDIDWLRERWPGRLVVKGVQSAADARICVDRGADAVWISSHGGRQLDRAPVPLRSLADVRAVLADTDAEVYVDSGIMSGSDIVAATALGADFTFVGRAYLYGLMAGGTAGVQRAVDILRADIVRTMQLIGVSSLDELTPDHVRLLP